MSLLALGSILTSLIFGWLGDRWNKALLCSLGTIPTIIAMIGLVFGEEAVILYFFPIGFAITMGTSSLNWALIGDLFGRHSYATLRGIMGVGYGIATFLSPIYAGWIFDRTGSYDIVLDHFRGDPGHYRILFCLPAPSAAPSGQRMISLPKRGRSASDIRSSASRDQSPLPQGVQEIGNFHHGPGDGVAGQTRKLDPAGRRRQNRLGSFLVLDEESRDRGLGLPGCG